MSTVDTCRAEFEAWAENSANPLLHVFSIAQHPNLPRYLEGVTELCWLAWQAARRTEPVDIAALRKDAEPDYKRFAVAVLRDARENLGADVDGGFVQDTAAACGLLIETDRTEPCGDDCNCVEYGFPVTCYSYSDDVRAALAAQGEQG